MVENFLKKNWRTVILGGLCLLGWFVWPTPYIFWIEKGEKGSDYMRINRFTGKPEAYWYGLGQWRSWDRLGWTQADREDEELKKFIREKIKTAK